MISADSEATHLSKNNVHHAGSQNLRFEPASLPTSPTVIFQCNFQVSLLNPLLSFEPLNPKEVPKIRPRETYGPFVVPNYKLSNSYLSV